VHSNAEKRAAISYHALNFKMPKIIKPKTKMVSIKYDRI